MKALGYSTGDQVNPVNSFGLTGQYFGRALLGSTGGTANGGTGPGASGPTGGTVTVLNPSIGANDLIFLTPIGSTAGSDGMLSVQTTASTSFTITSSNALDRRNVNFMIVINTI
jgi:hypothetical protein